MMFRDLEIVRQIIDEATGLEVSYAFEDLVFPDHTAFIIQYSDKDDSQLFCHFHKDCQGADREKLVKSLTSASLSKKINLEVKDEYVLEQEGEEVKIVFSKS